MDTVTFFIVAIIAVFACIVIAAFLVFRKRGKVDIRGPIGTGLKIDVSNESSPPTPAVMVQSVVSKGGGVNISDQTGRGADVRGVEAQRDVSISSAPPAKDLNPKA